MYTYISQKIRLCAVVCNWNQVFVLRISWSRKSNWTRIQIDFTKPLSKYNCSYIWDIVWTERASLWMKFKYLKHCATSKMAFVHSVSHFRSRHYQLMRPWGGLFLAKFGLEMIQSLYSLHLWSCSLWVLLERCEKHGLQ